MEVYKNNSGKYIFFPDYVGLEDELTTSFTTNVGWSKIAVV